MLEDSKDVSHICLANHTNKRMYKARVLVQPFGSRCAPANLGRAVTFTQLAAVGILHITAGAFAGDVFCVESHRLATIGFRAFGQLRTNRLP